MDIYINLDALDLKTAAVVSKDDLRSKPVKELVAGENQIINLYTTAKTGSPNIQDYSTVRVGIGTINAVPTSGSYIVEYGVNSELIAYNATAADIKTKFYSITSAQIQTVTEIAPQTFKIDFQFTGQVPVPSITDDTALYPSSTVTISELAVGSANTKASWLVKTNQDALALVDTFTNISPQGITGVLNTATTGIYEKLQSQKFFKTTLEVEVVDSSSRLRTVLQVPISVKGEVIGLSVEPPHATPSPYALVTYVDSKTAANASNITTNASAIASHTTNLNSLNDGQSVNDAAIALKSNKANPTFTGNVTCSNPTNNTKKFTKQKSYGTNGAVELQRGTSTDDQLTLSWDGPTSSNFSIVQHINGVVQGQIKFSIDPSTHDKLSLDAKVVDVGSGDTILTKLFSNTNVGAKKKFVFVDSRNKDHGLHFEHTGPNAPTFQFGMAGAAYNSADFGQFKIRHTTSAGVTEDVIVVDKDNGFTKLESDYTEVKDLKVTGDITASDFTATSRISGAQSLNSLQNFQPATDDTVTNLCVDPSGNVVRGSQEATWTFTRAQLNALNEGSRYTLLASAGTDTCICVEESYWLIESDHTKSGTFPADITCEIEGATQYSVATRVTASRLTTLCGSVFNGQAVYTRDVPELDKMLAFGKHMTIRIPNHNLANAFPEKLIGVTLKIKYRVFDKATF